MSIFYRYRNFVDILFTLLIVAVAIPGGARAALTLRSASLIKVSKRLTLTAKTGTTASDHLFSKDLFKSITSARPLFAFSLINKDNPETGAAAVVTKQPTVMPDDGAPSIPVSANGPFVVKDGSGQTVVTVAGGQQIKITYFQEKYYLFGASGFIVASANSFQVEPRGSSIVELPNYSDWNWNKTVNLNKFRGAIEVVYSTVSHKLWAVNTLPLEDYLKGVSEASADAPEEHLKVMSIIERSYAWYHLHNNSRHQGEPFDLKNSRGGNGDDQIYQGYLAEQRLPRLAAAAVKTSGQVVTYQGNPVITPYSSNPGGRTRTPKEAGWNYNWPWVQSVPDPDTVGMRRDGHGVGLSGYGSRKRAERGKSAAQILSYYFPATAIGTVPTAGVNIRIAIYAAK